VDQVAGDREIGNGALATERAAVTQARERLGQDLDRLDSEVRAQVAGGVQTVVWKMSAAGLGLVAAAGVRKAMTFAWRQARKHDPPDDPSSPDTSWGEALGWTIAMAVGVGVARLLAERGAAAGWEKATGARPPHRA
jgi:hypothetical protein